MDRDLSTIQEQLNKLRDERNQAENALAHAAHILDLESILLYA